MLAAPVETPASRMPPENLLAPALLTRGALSAGTQRRQQLYLISTCSWCSAGCCSFQTRVTQLRTQPLARQLSLNPANLCWLWPLLPTPAGTLPR